MRSGFSKRLNDLPRAITSIVNEVLKEYIERIYTEAMARAPESVRSSYRVEIHPNEMRVELWTENEMAAYLEFGTGGHAVKLLSGKPQEMRYDSVLFFKTGEGTLPAQPYLFPAYYRYKDQIPLEIDKRIQKYLDNI